MGSKYHDIKLGYITYKEADHIRQIFTTEGYTYNIVPLSNNKIDFNIFIEFDRFGSFSAAIGVSALYNNTSGGYNVAIGYQTLQSTYNNIATDIQAISPAAPPAQPYDCHGSGSLSSTFREALPELDQIQTYELQISKNFVIEIYNTDIIQNRNIREALLEYLV